MKLTRTHFMLFFLCLFSISCQTRKDKTVLPPPTIPTVASPSVDKPQIMFYSNRDGKPGWYIMERNGSNVRYLSFPMLSSRKIESLRWIPGLGLFLAELSDAKYFSDLYLLDMEGNILYRVTNDPDPEGEAVYSSIAGKFAYVCLESELDVCVSDYTGQNRINLTLLPSRDTNPQWTRDGQQVLFVSNRSGVPGLWLVNRDGTNLKNLSNQSSPELSPSYSPDGTLILFESQRDMNSEIYIMGKDGSGAVNLTHNPARDTEPIWSPVGSHIAFRSDRNQGNDLFVMKANGSEVVNITNTPNIIEGSFVWSLDGDRIFYSAEVQGQLDVFSVRSDGQENKNLTNNPAQDTDPQWMDNVLKGQ